MRDNIQIFLILILSLVSFGLWEELKELEAEEERINRSIEIEKDINSNDDNSTVYNWVFIKN